MNVLSVMHAPDSKLALDDTERGFFNRSFVYGGPAFDDLPSVRHRAVLCAGQAHAPLHATRALIRSAPFWFGPGAGGSDRLPRLLRGARHQ
jgi:hypothetical protein